MPCYNPITGYRSRVPNENGKFPVVFKVSQGYYDYKITVPCGKCVGCRLDRARDWSVRCVHEASMHKLNCVITLTYSDVNLPLHGSLDKKHFQDFIKRLRKYIDTNKRYRKFVRKNYNMGRLGLRYFHCGEYGVDFSRPHYHACLFGFDFIDKKFYKESAGSRLYRSKVLEKLWPFGFSLVGDMSVESAAYIARYVTKKVYGSKAAEHYGNRIPEYVTMSRRPGIGASWVEKYKSDVYPLDYVVLKGGMKVKPSRFYDEKFSLTNSEDLIKIKTMRVNAAIDNPDNVPARLKVRRHVSEAGLSMFKRGLENEVASV